LSERRSIINSSSSCPSRISIGRFATQTVIMLVYVIAVLFVKLALAADFSSTLRVQYGFRPEYAPMKKVNIEVSYNRIVTYGGPRLSNTVKTTAPITLQHLHDDFIAFSHPNFPEHAVRMKKTEFCDSTVKCGHARL
jgi:hypothetical protein